MRYLYSSDVYTLLMITCVLGFIQAQCPDCGLNGNCVHLLLSMLFRLCWI